MKETAEARTKRILPLTLFSDKNVYMTDAPDNARDIEWYINESPELAEARAAGVDLWALWANLHRTPEERMRRHGFAIQTMRKLRNAKKISPREPDEERVVNQS